MPQEVTFRVVVVGEDHGVGVSVVETADQVVVYQGKALTVRL
jgi:hypothetical protein